MKWEQAIKHNLRKEDGKIVGSLCLTQYEVLCMERRSYWKDVLAWLTPEGRWMFSTHWDLSSGRLAVEWGARYANKNGLILKQEDGDDNK